jgi:hypothetical protein
MGGRDKGRVPSFGSVAGDSMGSGWVKIGGERNEK